MTGGLALLWGEVTFADTPMKPVAKDAKSIQPLGVGDAIPEGVVHDANGKAVDLLAAVRKKPTLLLFYRGGWCPFCNRHLQSVGEFQADFAKMGYQILAVGTDKPEVLKDMVADMKLPYTLLSDSSMEMGRKFGLVYNLDPSYYKAVGRLLHSTTGQDNPWLPVPAAYIVDTKGVIRFAYVNPEFRVRANPIDLIDAAKAALSPAKPVSVH
jgi:peroxiredoxin